ncbi:DUF6461 domain-containing protein [Plantactinospora sp. B5E13]|uniref:DUF6461 domain-containing protein n=1 Tax=unclassified Plantactinospora TaxID=2631981 RepID=UPI00325EF8AC
MNAEQVAESWAVVERWLASNAPQTYTSLRPPADPAAVEAAQQTIGVTFPEDLVASLARHDGADDGPGAFTLGGSYQLMRVEEIPRRWRTTTDALGMSTVDDEDHHDEDDGLLGWYWHPQWVPFGKTNSVDMLVVDCRPGVTYGAVGVHLKGDVTHFGHWPSLADLLADIADGLDRDRPVRHWHPAADGVRLHWELVQEQHPAPRSPLDLAAEARESGTPAPPTVRPAMRRLRQLFPPAAEAGRFGGYHHFGLAFVADVDEAELLRRFGADPAQATPRTREQARELRDSWTEGFLPVLRVGRVDGWAFAVEEQRSPEGVRPEVLRRLSVGTRAVALRHTGHSTRFTLVVDGTVITGYDTLRPERRHGREPDLFLPALRDAGLVPLDTTRYPDEDIPAVLDVLRAELGIAFHGELLRPALSSAQFLPALPGPPTSGAFPAQAEPTVVARLTYADEERLLVALLAQARRLAAETGLDGYPELVEALDRATAGEHRPPEVDDNSPLGLRVRRIAAEAHAADAMTRVHGEGPRFTEAERRAWLRRRQAAEAIVGLLGPAPVRISGTHLLQSRLHPAWREQFAADLGPVDVPDGAVEELVAAEQRAAAAAPVLVPVIRRPARRPPPSEPVSGLRHGSGTELGRRLAADPPDQPG